MPRAWSAKDERMYEHIVRSCMKKELRDHFNNRVKRRRSPKSSLKSCKRIAAATVNSLRRRQGRTLSGLEMIDSQHINMLNHHIGEAKKYLGVLDRESSCQEALDALYDANKHLASADSHLSSVEFENRENELKQLKILGKKIRSHKEQFFGSACFDQELFNHGHFYGLKKQLKLPRS